MMRLTLGFAFLFAFSIRAATVDWTMINVNSKTQGDAHLLEWPSGEKFLVDAGNQGEGAAAFLKKRNIGELEAVIITHAHKDHYAGIRDLIANGVKIKKVYFAMPPAKPCEHEKGWGCDSGDIANLVKLLSSKSIPVASLKRGDVIRKDKESSLEVLYAHDGISPPVGETDINDTSLIMMLTVGKKRALLTGDLNRLYGTYLAKEAKDIKADILKAPHHGTEGCAPDVFFDTVGAKIILVPSPKDLWESERSSRMKKYFTKHAKKVWVNGIDGDVLVKMSPNEIQVESLKLP